MLPRLLAFDGKSVGHGRCGIVLMVCRQEDGRPVAMTVARGRKEACGVPKPRALLGEPPVRFLGDYQRHLRYGVHLVLNGSPVL